MFRRERTRTRRVTVLVAAVLGAATLSGLAAPPASAAAPVGPRPAPPDGTSNLELYALNPGGVVYRVEARGPGNVFTNGIAPAGANANLLTFLTSSEATQRSANATVGSSYVGTTSSLDSARIMAQTLHREHVGDQFWIYAIQPDENFVPVNETLNYASQRLQALAPPLNSAGVAEDEVTANRVAYLSQLRQAYGWFEMYAAQGGIDSRRVLAGQALVFNPDNRLDPGDWSSVVVNNHSDVTLPGSLRTTPTNISIDFNDYRPGWRLPVPGGGDLPGALFDCGAGPSSSSSTAAPDPNDFTGQAPDAITDPVETDPYDVSADPPIPDTLPATGGINRIRQERWCPAGGSSLWDYSFANQIVSISDASTDLSQALTPGLVNAIEGSTIHYGVNNKAAYSLWRMTPAENSSYTIRNLNNNKYLCMVGSNSPTQLRAQATGAGALCHFYAVPIVANGATGYSLEVAGSSTPLVLNFRGGSVTADTKNAAIPFTVWGFQVLTRAKVGPGDNTVVTIKNNRNLQALDQHNWSPQPYNFTQKWLFAPAGDGFYQIVNETTDDTLAPAISANLQDAYVYVYPRTSAVDVSTALWRLVPVPNQVNNYYIVNVYSGKYLDGAQNRDDCDCVTQRDKAEGVPRQQWTINTWVPPMVAGVS